mmetsp:Transcript_16464/g.33595  ORF Transcript_16464/g.33595 Transcript_16464/m.33595 type:complete len:91 (+) Transcript_16464:576-848(+)
MEVKGRDQELAELYGVHMPARRQLDRVMLRQFHRLPGFESSFVGLDDLDGKGEMITLDDYLGIPWEQPNVAFDLRAEMEAKLGMKPFEPL